MVGVHLFLKRLEYKCTICVFRHNKFIKSYYNLEILFFIVMYLEHRNTNLPRSIFPSLHPMNFKHRWAKENETTMKRRVRASMRSASLFH